MALLIAGILKNFTGRKLHIAAECGRSSFNNLESDSPFSSIFRILEVSRQIEKIFAPHHIACRVKSAAQRKEKISGLYVF